MGVRGLTTYINFNQDVFLKQYFLHDTNLVVDGHSLCAQLYRSLNCFSAFGGDYDKYASYTRNFFKNLRKCNITAYVLFDGSYEPRKLKTAFNRLRSKIYGASRLDPVTQGSLQIFPLLLRDVFKEVLTEMDVPFTVCEFEADDEIAAMARYLGCPVLSYDSDFFIYNVLYIPFNTIEKKPKIIEEDGNRISVIECKLYRTEYLTQHFGGLNEELLPLLATLLGNDYVEKRVFNKFFSQLKLPKGRQLKNDQQRCIHALFKWLQNETLDSAIEKIIGRLKKHDKKKVFLIIKKSVAGYNRKHCPSLKYFNIDEDEESTETVLIMPNDNYHDDETISDDGDEAVVDEESDNNSSDHDNTSENDWIGDEEVVLNMPDWLAKGIRNKTIPQTYIDLYTMHLHFCLPQAEDYKDDDSFLCTLPLLRYAFDILTDFSKEDLTYVCREKDCNYKKMAIGLEFSTTRFSEKNFCELTPEELKQYFYHFLKEKLLNLNLEEIRLLPENFQLFMISLLWWVTTCKVALSHIHSLLICYVMLEVVDERTGTIRGHNFFMNKYSKKIEKLKKSSTLDSFSETELFLNKNKVQYEHCLIAASVLLKHFEIDETIRKRPKTYDPKKMHLFAQFQCCLLQFNCLNTLCREPFHSTKYSKCYNGTFLYNIALKLESQLEPVSYLENYLKGAASVLMFYRSLVAVYQRCADKMGITTFKSIGKKRRHRKKGKLDEEINKEIDFIVKGFESEVII